MMSSTSLPDESARLSVLQHYAVLDTPPEQALDDLAALAAHICEAPIALISLVDEDRQWFKSRFGLEVPQTPREFSFCAHALQQTDLLIVPDTMEDARFAKNPLVTGAPGIRFYAGAPLVSPEGVTLGTLCVIDRVPRLLMETQAQALRVLGRQVMTQLELRRQARELSESEERSRAIVESALDAIVTIDHESLITEFNVAAEKMFGWSRAEVLGREMAEVVIPPEARAAHRRGMARYLETGQAVVLDRRLELTAQRRDGSVFPVELTATRLGRTSPPRFTAFLRDITQRKLTDEKLQRLNRLYAVSGAINAAIMHMRWTQELYEQACRIAVERGELAMAWVGLVEPEQEVLQPVARWGRDEGYLESVRISVRDEVPEGRAFRTAAMACCPDIAADAGSLATKEAALQRGFRSCAAFPLKLDGQPVGVLAVYGDQAGFFDTEELQLLSALADNISFAVESHQREQRRRDAEAESRRTTDLLRVVADGIPDAVFVKDRQGRYLLFNTAAARFVGRAVEEVLGRDDTEIFGGEDARLVQAGDRRVLESGEVHTAEEVLTAAGTTRTYLATKAPYRDGRGKIIGLIGIARDITARKQEEEETRRLAERLTTTLESLTEGFFTLDRDWRFSYVNREAERMLKRPRAELLGRQIWEQFPEARGTIFEEAYLRAIRENVATQFETYFPPFDCWFEARAYPSTQGLAVYFRDVSEQHRALEALRISEERFRLLAKATNDAIWDWNLETNDRWWNEGLFTLFGFRPEEVEPGAISWKSRVHPEDRERVVGTIHEVIDEGRATWVDEYRFLRKDGSYAYVLDRGYVIRDNTGRPVRMIGGMTDLSERRRAEEQIAEQAALLDKAQDAILVRDLDHHVTFWNKSAERLYGWSQAEALGQSVRELLYEDPLAFDAATRRVFEYGEWIGELAQVSKDRRRLTIEGRWTLVRDEGGQPRGVLAINTDITERKKLEQQFLRAQRMESIGTLAGGIAHDLNNVLGPIILSLDLLKMRFTDRDSQELISIIGTSAERGADMVRQVLSFARGVEGQRLEVQVKHLLHDIEKIINETFLKHIQVRAIVPYDLWSVLGDPTQLHQVLLNLCVNARDAMPHGGTLLLSAENVTIDPQYAGLNPEARPGGYVFLQVEDSGTGMMPEIIEKIFDPFFTTKGVGQGTGLGLSTSLAIVKSHGGFIRVYSELGKGTKFKVYLPAHTAQAGGAPVVAPAEMPRGHGELILVVDDEASVRQITEQTLEAFGYRVVLAGDGAEAVAVYASRGAEIAVVLTDMMMPVMDGPATIQVLRRMNPKLPIIAASGLSANGHVANAASLGVKHFLPKPYTAETLLKVLKQILSGSV